MAKDVASVVICEECGEQVAEVVVDAKRALCSECHLMESGTRSRGAKTIATACPYCMIMLDDAVKEKELEEEIEVMDLSQLMLNSIEN